MNIRHFLFLVVVGIAEAFTTPASRVPVSKIPTAMNMAIVSPPSTVGIVGRGFISVLTAKLAALKGYNTWMLMPPGQRETILELLTDDAQGIPNLELIEATDADRFNGSIESTHAVIIAVDDDSTMDEMVIKYVLNPDTAKNVKRVVAMSRNLNGRDMGFFVKASKLSANSEVWDGSKTTEYQEFENIVKRQAALLDAEYTILRAGTLKGAGRGIDEEPFDQFLSKKYYEMVKKDIINWQLLFDCNVRGVSLSKGDVLPGPGSKAVFTAIDTKACPGDTSRCGIAEAIVRSLEFETTANIDFGVATKDSRTPPTDEEWSQMFANL
jgi:hypothetical protein